MSRERTWRWRRMRRYGELSRGRERSSPRRFFPDCTIAMPGYDFREGQEDILELPLTEGGKSKFDEIRQKLWALRQDVEQQLPRPAGHGAACADAANLCGSGAATAANHRPQCRLTSWIARWPTR